MKKLLLSGVTMLFLATGTAHATDQLPAAMIKHWCWNDGERAYTQQEQCGHDFLIVRREGYESLEGGECVFDMVERVAQDTYQTHAKCKPFGDDELDSEPWTENLELQLIRGQLTVGPANEG
jgi:hypothetical protein